jgi:hypothetical protein
VRRVEPGYWPSNWPGEDAGPRRLQHPRTGAGPALEADAATVASREAIAATMLVLREPGEAYLLRHTAGPDATSWVERVDPITLEVLARSDDLAGGPTWPGGLAAHANGSLYVVFGNHTHRLGADLAVLASRTLPRVRPYNSFVLLPDGHLVTKDFGGVLPGQDRASHTPETCTSSAPTRCSACTGTARVSRSTTSRCATAPCPDRPTGGTL